MIRGTKLVYCYLSYLMVVDKFSHTVYVCIGVYAQFSKLHIKTNSIVFCVAKKADVQHQSSRHTASCSQESLVHEY